MLEEMGGYRDTRSSLSCFHLNSDCANWVLNWKLDRDFWLVYGDLILRSLFYTIPKDNRNAPSPTPFHRALNLLIWTCNQHLDNLSLQNLLECLLCLVEWHLTGDQLLHINFTTRHQLQRKLVVSVIIAE